MKNNNKKKKQKREIKIKDRMEKINKISCYKNKRTKTC